MYSGYDFHVVSGEIPQSPYLLTKYWLSYWGAVLVATAKGVGTCLKNASILEFRVWHSIKKGPFTPPVIAVYL